jgi:putative hydrolase of the HAD superfamily
MIRSDITSDNTTSTQRTYKAVVFDLDETLYPYEQYMVSGFQAVSRFVDNAYGVRILDELIGAYHRGETLRGCFESALGVHFKQVASTLVNRLQYVFAAHEPCLDLHEDARVCLALLIARNVRVAVLADGPSEIQHLKMQALGLEPLVDALIYPDELIGGRACWQPCEDPFHILALQLEADLQDMVFVGDNPRVDFLAPRKLGLATVRVCRGKGRHDHEAPISNDYAADVSLPTLYSLADLVQHGSFKGVS